MAEKPWWVWCPQKVGRFTTSPDFSGLDPDTGEPWSPRKIVEIMGIGLQDASETRDFCEKVIQDHPKEAEKYRAGKTKVLGMLIKEVLTASGGSAEPRDAKDILVEILSK